MLREKSKLQVAEKYQPGGVMMELMFKVLAVVAIAVIIVLNVKQVHSYRSSKSIFDDADDVLWGEQLALRLETMLILILSTAVIIPLVKYILS